MAEFEADGTSLRLHSLDVIVKDVLNEIKERGDTPALPTGIKILDEAIWGLHPRECTVISASPSEGKTALALQISHHLTKLGKRVVFISLEMSRWRTHFLF